MTRIFIGGSRRISKLNSDIKSKLDEVIQHGYAVLMGDANGADKSVQNYLAIKKYRNVLIFCMENRCRNNIGSWPVQKVYPLSGNKASGYYAVKDLEMARETDTGFMIWDAKSKGTLRNILNLLRDSKKTLVYFAPDQKCYELNDVNDLKRILAKCDKRSLEVLEKQFDLSRSLGPPADDRASERGDRLGPPQLPLWPTGNTPLVREK